MDINETLRDAEFKDERPLKTVEKIKSILSEYGFKVTEHWADSGVPYCYSFRATMDGTGFGVNGKGLTKEFALASGYGELMERLQFGFFGSVGMQKDVVFTENELAIHRVPMREHVMQNRRWYENLTKRLYAYTGQIEDPESVLERYTDSEGNIKAFEYFNLTKNEPTFFPLGLHGIYTTNGAAAGNTMEEALVQGISETVERNHQIRIIYEGMSMPNIPEEVLEKYETAYKIITYVRECGFKVVIKDASLGTKFPVVCAVFINEKTGKYHTHFGAYPIFEIALERSLTETFQGRNLKNVASFEEFHYDRSRAYAVDTLLMEMVKGSAQKHIDFFVGTPKYPYNTEVGFRGKNNQELLMECLDYFTDMGYDVLARDRSSLGFPSYQVIIPGYSEWAIHRLSGIGDDSSQQPLAVRVLRYPTKASKEELHQLSDYLELQKKYGKLTLGGGKEFRKKAMISANIPETLDDQLLYGTLAYVYYGTGNFAEAVEYVSRMNRSGLGKSAEYLTCVKRYLKMKIYGYTQEQIEAGIRFFHKEQTCEKLLACIAEDRNPFEAYTIRCDNMCTPECELYGLCNQKRAQEMMDLIQKKISEMSFADFAQKVKRFFDSVQQ